MDKRVNLTKVDAQIDDVTFSITGPPDKVASIVKYIRHLSRLMEGKLDG